MNFPPISNGSANSIQSTGNSLPNMSDTLSEYLQDMSFVVITKDVSAFELSETSVTTLFKGVRQPHKPTDMDLEKIGYRAWPWWMIHSTSDLELKEDDKIFMNSKNHRVISILSYGDEGYFQYKIVEDYS